jgi:cytochrome c551/c552
MKITNRFFLLSILTLFALTRISAQTADEGKKLFEANCQSCHAVYQDVTGPKLKDIEKRRPMDWIIKWVKNPPAMIKSDAYAKALADKWSPTIMTAFGSLSDKEIKSIVEYIKTAPEPVTAIIDNGGGDPKDPNDKGSGSFYSSTTLIILLALVLILVMVTMLLGRVKHVLETQVWNKNPELAPDTDGKSFWKDIFWPWVAGWNKTVAVIMGLFLFLVFFAVPMGFKYANNEIGVQKGYAPAQPINFSHKIHAGDYKINCQYCHSGVEKSKQATIPSASTCMNCHTHVQAKEKYNGQISPEIQKIYTAIGYNAETRKYDKPQQPIRWVRIHNLPDHAVFNHSTHVKVGKVACQKCHGEVQEMAVVYQRNSLQMGWCINCHRESNVDVASNPYYEKLHARMKSEKKSEIKVAENGGLECSKCHY